MRYNYLPLSKVRVWECYAAALGVSKVARSSRGFLAAYKKAGGNPSKLSEAWRIKRDAFVARHMAQMRGEAKFKDGMPTRRHLALIMWAYSPTPSRLSSR